MRAERRVLLRLQDDVLGAAPAKNESSVALLASRRGGAPSPKWRASAASSRSWQARIGAVLKRVAAGRTLRGGRAVTGGAAASGSASDAVHDGEVGLRRHAPGWSASSHPKKPRVHLGPGREHAPGASWITAIECSCCRRVTGSAGAPSAAGIAARARREAVELERVGREARRRGRASPTSAHGVPAVHREVLPDREHEAALGVHERRVVDVLAHVVLVHADRAVGCERQILRVHERRRSRARCPTLARREVPEPRRRRRGEHERERRSGSPCHSPRTASRAVVDGDRAGARRSEERRRRRSRRRAAGGRRSPVRPRSRFRGRGSRRRRRDRSAGSTRCRSPRW